MRQNLRDFCNNSSIHGIRYFSERRRHWSEKLWWAIAFVLSFMICCSSIRNIFLKWYDNPVSLSLSEKMQPISTIPFPSVTICPYSKFRKDKFDLRNAFETWVEAPENISDTDINRVRTLFHICEHHGFFTPPYDGDDFTNNSIYEIIKDIAPAIDDISMRCAWKSEHYPCSEFLKPIFTDDGLCYVFNALNSHEIYTEHVAPELMTVKRNPNVSNWSPDDGYNIEFQKNEYPTRIFNSKQGLAFHTTLMVHLNASEFLCAAYLEGFKVTLTTPGDARKSSTRYFNALVSEQMDIFIKPKLVTTSSTLRKYLPIQRQCFFSDERQLHYFKIYTQNNCELECLSNFTKFDCGCVKFSSPRDRNTKICGNGNIQCYRDAEEKLYGEDVVNDFNNDSVKIFRDECNCLPSCTSIIYDADIDRTKFDYMRVLKSLGQSKGTLSSVQMSLLSIFFIEKQVTILQRVETQTVIDFLAMCGGLLGLFLGVSALSIIEFIYYSTLRLFWNIRRSKNKNAVVPFQRKIIKRGTINSFNAQKWDYLE